MKFDTETAREFIGGQLEAQNWAGQYVFGGEISDAYVEESTNMLRVNLAWSALGTNFPLVKKLVADNRLTYSANLEIYKVSRNELGIVCLDAKKEMGEIARLFPRNRRQIDPSKVEGLVLKAKR